MHIWQPTIEEHLSIPFLHSWHLVLNISSNTSGAERRGSIGGGGVSHEVSALSDHSRFSIGGGSNQKEGTYQSEKDASFGMLGAETL